MLVSGSQPEWEDFKRPILNVMERIGLLNAMFGLSETYRRGRGLSMRLTSGLKDEGAGCEQDLPEFCALLAHRIFPRNLITWGAVG